MSDDPADRFVLALRPPVRALAITAVAALLGALLVVLSQVLELGLVPVIIGGALLFFAVSLGLMPTTGLTLPFMSFGRSSLVISLIGAGMLINVGRMRGRPSRLRRAAEE